MIARVRGNRGRDGRGSIKYVSSSQSTSTAGRRCRRFFGRRDEAVGDRDDFVSGSDAERAEDELERIGPGTDTDGVLGPAKRRPRLFERRHFRSEDELAVPQHRVDGGIELGAQHLRLLREI